MAERPSREKRSRCDTAASKQATMRSRLMPEEICRLEHQGKAFGEKVHLQHCPGCQQLWLPFSQILHPHSSNFSGDKRCEGGVGVLALLGKHQDPSQGIARCLLLRIPSASRRQLSLLDILHLLRVRAFRLSRLGGGGGTGVEEPQCQ